VEGYKEKSRGNGFVVEPAAWLARAQHSIVKSPGKFIDGEVAVKNVDDPEKTMLPQVGPTPDPQRP